MGTIHRLDDSVISVLHSQTNIPSFEQCVSEVVQNCLDAGATNIEVVLDLEHFGFTVCDNGQGIKPENMDCIAKRAYTSKCSQYKDLESMSTYGFRGEALASIAAMGLLTVTSQQCGSSGSSRSHTVRIHNSKCIASYASDEQINGTRVSVSDLYGNIPVRRKASKISLQSVKLALLPLFVCSQYAALSVFVGSSRKFHIPPGTVSQEKTPRCVQVIRAMGLDLGDWQVVSSSSSPGDGNAMHVHGVIGKSLHKCQYILVNSRIVVNTALYNRVRRLLGKQNSLFILSVGHVLLSAPDLLQDPMKCIHESVHFDAVFRLIENSLPRPNTVSSEQIRNKRQKTQREGTGQTSSKSRISSVNRQLQEKLQLKITKRMPQSSFSSSLSTKTKRSRTLHETDDPDFVSLPDSIQVSKYFSTASSYNNDSTPLDQKVTRTGLAQCKILGQIQKAFIMVKIPSCTGNDGGRHNLLALIDQHAADERVKVERIISDFIAHPKNTTSLSLPVSVNVPENIVTSLKQWGIIVNDAGNVTHVPQIAHRKCNSDPEYVASMVHEFAHDVAHGAIPSTLVVVPTPTWHVAIQSCPRKLREILNSIACRSAVKFGDDISTVECEELVFNLTKCQFPFQCAHGRPSAVPLVYL